MRNDRKGQSGHPATHPRPKNNQNWLFEKMILANTNAQGVLMALLVSSFFSHPTECFGQLFRFPPECVLFQKHAVCVGGRGEYSNVCGTCFFSAQFLAGSPYTHTHIIPASPFYDRAPLKKHHYPKIRFGRAGVFCLALDTDPTVTPAPHL